MRECVQVRVYVCAREHKYACIRMDVYVYMLTQNKDADRRTRSYRFVRSVRLSEHVCTCVCR